MCVCAWATEVLLPPPKLSAVINGSNLLVSWALPSHASSVTCYEYQLDLGDQVRNACAYTDARRTDGKFRNIRVSCAISMF